MQSTMMVNDEEISTCGWIIEVHSVQSTMMVNDGEISTCGWIIEVHSVQSTMMGRSQHAMVGGWNRLPRCCNYNNVRDVQTHNNLMTGRG